MIRTSTQLKAKIQNISGGDGNKAQTLIRNYMMERFLERCAVSKYRERIILKGGMFVASYVGLDSRATMDIDTTVQAIPLTIDSVTGVIQEIIEIPLEDGVTFYIASAREIMKEQEYPGLRFVLDAVFDRIKQPIKIDISTGDVITPAAIEYFYPLMFENRSISVLAYNLETVLGEKMETILSRAEANTRMRDFYDIYILLAEKQSEIRQDILQAAFLSTCRKLLCWHDYLAGSYYRCIEAGKNVKFVKASAEKLTPCFMLLPASSFRSTALMPRWRRTAVPAPSR